jgi:hypothetical protein
MTREEFQKACRNRLNTMYEEFVKRDKNGLPVKEPIDARRIIPDIFRREIELSVNNWDETIPCNVKGQMRMWINCKGTGNEINDYCAIYVEYTPVSRSISEGDSFWWQGDNAFWTPKNKPFEDMKIQRIGSSGRSRPEVLQKIVGYY